MKWFFALNEAAAEFPGYADMTRAAVFTARRFTTLEPYFLYDGSENDLTAWVRRQGCTVVHCRTFLYAQLCALAKRWGTPRPVTVGGGFFLRCEIPRLMAELGLTDTFVLYTDCDVLFQKDVVPDLQRLRPRWFAAALEDVHCPRLLNAGVMLMNVPALRRVQQPFHRFTVRHLEALIREGGWDQAAFREFFVYGLRAVGDGFWARWRRKLSRPSWEQLPLSFNWRPYWGENSDAHIIHFHGPKPFQRLALAEPDPALELRAVRHLTGPGYERWSQHWEEVVRRAG